MANEPSRIGTFESIGSAVEKVVRKAGGETPADPYARWRQYVANPKKFFETLQQSLTPDPGFYRRRLRKGGPWVPVWVYPQLADGRWVALRTVEGTPQEVDGEAEWEYCRSHPITQAEYELVAEQGQEWSDADPTVGAHLRARRPGSNEPVDEAEILQSQIESAIAGAKAYELVDSDDKAMKAQSLRSRLLELERQGDKAFHAEKDPLTKRGKEIDERWRFRSDATAVAKRIRDALDKYETAKLQKRRAEEEAARRAAAEVERKAQEAELSFVQQPAAPEPEATPAPAAAPETTIKGSYGRAATISTEWVVTGIADQDALYRFMRDHADIKACLLNLAQRATKAGHDVPGITKSEQARVR